MNGPNALFFRHYRDFSHWLGSQPKSQSQGRQDRLHKSSSIICPTYHYAIWHATVFVSPASTVDLSPLTYDNCSDASSLEMGLCLPPTRLFKNKINSAINLLCAMLLKEMLLMESQWLLLSPWQSRKCRVLFKIQFQISF